MKSSNNLPTNVAMVLRVGGGICFLGHGILALGAKAGFVGLLGTFGLNPEQAVMALKVIGLVDVAVGLSILLKPTKRVLQWAMVWTALTIVAWGIHGDSLMDLARRIPYTTTPLALLFLLFGSGTKRNSSLPGTENAVLPALGQDNSSLLALSKEKAAAIRDLDLSMICMKLMDEHDGEGWTRQQCQEVAQEYRRFLTLHLLFPDEPIVPNLAIDTVWHYHILDTAAYQRDCQTIFGGMLHHYPYFGMQGTEDARQFANAFDRTKALYEGTFGDSMDGPGFLPSFRVRRSA